MNYGLLHSIQSLGAVDGPGLRSVVILQGCPLRCKFCHSIDTTLSDRGEKISSVDLFHRVMRNKPYWQKYPRRSEKKYGNDPEIVGGVTITGGDPLSQPAFLLELLVMLNEARVHTVVETSLFTSPQVIDMLIDHVDLWMVSLKYMDDQKHVEITGRSNRAILENLKYLDQKLNEKGKKESLRIRYVVVPGLTDDIPNANEMARYLSNFRSLESIELLPYVTMGKYKWLQLYGNYELEGIPEASEEHLKSVAEPLRSANLPIFNHNF